MTLHIIGAILIVAGCSGIGYAAVFFHKREASTLKQFITVLEYMDSELLYRLTTLPQLCRNVKEICDGIVLKVFQELAKELENQIAPDVKFCMDAVLSRITDIPPLTRNAFQSLGLTLGRFDIDGQRHDIQIIKNECIQQLDRFTNNEVSRLRSYQTLAVCSGIGIAIILF